MTAKATPPAPKAERNGRCTRVGSWQPAAGSKRVLWRCRCQQYSHSVEKTVIPWEPVCVCGDTRAVHQIINPNQKEAQP